MSDYLDAVIDKDGHFKYGTFHKPFSEVNAIDFKKSYWGHLPRALKDKRLKEWHAYMIGGKTHYLLIGLMDLKFISIMKVMVYDKTSNQTWGVSKVIPLKKLKLSNSLINDTAFAQDESTLIYANHFLISNKIEVGFSFIDELSGEKVSGYFETGSKLNSPMVSVLPLINSAGLYTHKQLMSMKGSLHIGEDIIELKEKETGLVLDDQKVYYPYFTKWDWATASGIVNDDYCGFSISNINSLREQVNENGFWKNGRVHSVPDVRFCRNKTSGTWTIVDEKGLVNILFKPVTKHIVERNFGLAAGVYEGPLGWFSGHLTSTDGETLHVNGMFGMGEKMNLRL